MEGIKYEILDTIDNFNLYFGRNFDYNFFTSETDNVFCDFKSLDKIWGLETKEPKTPSKINKDKLIDINNKVYTYYDHLLKSFDKYSNKELDEMISKIFLLLSNIYDLFPDYIDIYLKHAWLNLHFKLIDTCLDINNPPKPGLSSNENDKIRKLYKFPLFFCLCLSNDNDFNTRLYLFENHPDLFYKIAIISSNNAHFCCCGHGISYNETDFCSNIKAILLVFETFKYFEDNNINNESINNIRKKILEFFFINIGKNPCIVYLYKMARMFENDWLFEHISNTTNLLKDAFEREKEKSGFFPHAIDGFEELIILCKNPDLLFQMLNIISPPEKGLKARIYREILKIIFAELSEDKYVTYIENHLYHNIIFQKALETLKKNVYLGDYEGIWQILLDSNNAIVVNIFFKMKNKYNFGEIMFFQLESLIKNRLMGERFKSAVKIMNLFLKMGDVVTKNYWAKNYYLEQFRDCYKKICDLDIKENEDEDVDEFKNYYKNN